MKIVRRFKQLSCGKVHSAELKKVHSCICRTKLFENLIVSTSYESNLRPPSSVAGYSKDFATIRQNIEVISPKIEKHKLTVF